MSSNINYIINALICTSKTGIKTQNKTKEIKVTVRRSRTDQNETDNRVNIEWQASALVPFLEKKCSYVEILTL